MYDVPDKIQDDLGYTYITGEILSEGGQGITCRIKGYDDLLVKFIFSDKENENIEFDNPKSRLFINARMNILRLMSMEKEVRLTMPISRIKFPYCGYIMRFIGKMEPIANLLERQTKEGSKDSHGKALRRKIFLLLDLAIILRKLHGKGLVYKDLSENNVFVPTDESLNHTWLIDIDNLDICNDKTALTPGFAAPEIINGITSNTAESDCYSFAILAFETLTGSGPFDGKESVEYDWSSEDTDDEPFEFKAAKGEIDYIYEENTDNTKKYGLSLDMCSTKEIADLFMRTFSKEGRNKPYTRPTMREWESAFSFAADNLRQCSRGHWHFGMKCDYCGDKYDKQNTQFFSVNCSRPQVFVTDEKTETEYIHEYSYSFCVTEKKRKTFEFPLYFLDRTDNVPCLSISFRARGDFSISVDFPYNIKQLKHSKEELKKFSICRMAKKDEIEICQCILKRENVL
ncbi:MAG: protein kinase [Anaerolineaceae bacterium]|nr:protein kinase [Anaerolineaceae bacterium]